MGRLRARSSSGETVALCPPSSGGISSSSFASGVPLGRIVPSMWSAAATPRCRASQRGDSGTRCASSSCSVPNTQRPRKIPRQPPSTYVTRQEPQIAQSHEPSVMAHVCAKPTTPRCGAGAISARSAGTTVSAAPAPTPMTVRPTKMSVTELDATHSKLPAMKSTSHASSVARRPKCSDGKWQNSAEKPAPTYRTAVHAVISKVSSWSVPRSARSPVIMLSSTMHQPRASEESSTASTAVRKGLGSDMLIVRSGMVTDP